MKIHASIRDVYLGRRPLIEALQVQVDGALQAGKGPRWHYESRVKELESFALKIETGRVRCPADLEDFLACTIVVPTTKDIADAFRLVESRFDVEDRRPPNDTTTKKDADTFRFDDLRVYCKRGDDGVRKSEPIDSIRFEVQIKTFLQHAWGIATHDLAYKTDDVTWGKDRIVAHLKAAIEFAELTVQQAEELSQTPSLQLGHQRTDELRNIINVLKRRWSREELPENLKSLADTLRMLMRDVGLSADALDAMLGAEINRTGNLSVNLSPYGVVLELLIRHHRPALEGALRNGRTKSVVVLTPELNLPDGFDAASFGERCVVVG